MWNGTGAVKRPGPAYANSCARNEQTKIVKKITQDGGSLGSWVDEERSKLRVDM